MNFRFEGAVCIGIRGVNGSGKSTLLKCLSGLLRPSDGTVTWQWNKENLDIRMIRYQIGFAAPYIQLYSELTVTENLSLIKQMRPKRTLTYSNISVVSTIENSANDSSRLQHESPSDHPNKTESKPGTNTGSQSNFQYMTQLPVMSSLLENFGLSGLAEHEFGTLSSGQQQRVKLAGALVTRPPILMLDEPGTNLDAAGLTLVSEIVTQHRSGGGMVFLASNRDEDLVLCDEIMQLSNPQPFN
ncbi:MAG: ATP-binding cassette domain-containing protein [Balneolales bacterium]